MFISQVADLVSRTQIERGRTALYLSSNYTNQDALDQLYEDRRITNQKLDELTWWPPITVSFPSVRRLSTKAQFIQYLYQFRLDVIGRKISFRQNVEILTEVNKQLLDVSLRYVRIPCSQTAPDLLFAFNVLLRATENAGIMRAVGSTFFVRCYLTKDDRIWIIKLETMTQTYLDLAGQYLPQSRDLYNSLLNQSHPLAENMQSMENYMTSPELYPVCENTTMETRFENGRYWFENNTVYVNHLKKVQTFAAHYVIDDVAKVSVFV